MLLVKVLQVLEKEAGSKLMTIAPMVTPTSSNMSTSEMSDPAFPAVSPSSSASPSIRAPATTRALRMSADTLRMQSQQGHRIRLSL
jgi:hypothetical protein